MTHPLCRQYEVMTQAIITACTFRILTYYCIALLFLILSNEIGMIAILNHMLSIMNSPILLNKYENVINIGKNVRSSMLARAKLLEQTFLVPELQNIM